MIRSPKTSAAKTTEKSGDVDRRIAVRAAPTNCRPAIKASVETAVLSPAAPSRAIDDPSARRRSGSWRCRQANAQSSAAFGDDQRVDVDVVDPLATTQGQARQAEEGLDDRIPVDGRSAALTLQQGASTQVPDGRRAPGGCQPVRSRKSTTRSSPRYAPRPP